MCNVMLMPHIIKQDQLWAYIQYTVCVGFIEGATALEEVKEQNVLQAQMHIVCKDYRHGRFSCDMLN